ncbi:MAG: hypothetical protein HQ573_01915 [Desulfobacteraceae bacterium]|nr:hypothetical protein [Desulfobacteraceae bacterium]
MKNQKMERNVVLKSPNHRRNTVFISSRRSIPVWGRDGPCNSFYHGNLYQEVQLKIII